MVHPNPCLDHAFGDPENIAPRGEKTHQGNNSTITLNFTRIGSTTAEISVRGQTVTSNSTPKPYCHTVTVGNNLTKS